MINLSSDLRNRFGPARDQGVRGTCLVFAISDTHSSLFSTWNELSVEYLYYHALLRSKDKPPAGAKLIQALEALKIDGQPLELAWPYQPQNPTDLKTWTPPKVNPLHRRDGAHHSGDINAIVKLLNQNEPVVVVMTISNAFYGPTKDGIIDATEAADPTRRHAVIAVAHGTDKHGSKFLLIRNSWGPTWGLNGYAFVSAKYLTPRLLKFLRLNGAI